MLNKNKKGKHTDYLAESKAKGLLSESDTQEALPQSPGSWGTHGNSPVPLQAHSLLHWGKYQNSLWIKSQANTDHWPFMSFCQCDCNSPVKMSHKMSSVLSPLFKFSIYLLFSLLSSKLPADALSGRLCLAQQRAHQTSTHITSTGQKLDTAAAHTQAGLCLLPLSHTLPERTNQRTAPGHSHPLAHLHRFSFTVRKMKKILPDYFQSFNKIEL